MRSEAAHSELEFFNGVVPARAVRAAPVVPWRKSDRPLKVAILGWARLSSQGREGSGYNLNASELARGLVLSGHGVAYLKSGMDYRIGLFGARRPQIRRREVWGGVECFDLLNSPNMAPAAVNFRNMQSEVAEPRSTGLVLGWLRALGAQVVHIHSQEGYGLDLIPAIEAAGLPVVATLHNYWFVCPQVDLLHKEREVCVDFEGGERCEGCMPGKDVRKLKTSRAMGRSLENWLGMYPADVVRKVVYGMRPLVRRVMRGHFRPLHDLPHHPDFLSDPELGLGFEGVQRTPGRGTEIEHDLPMRSADRPVPYVAAEWGTNERVLEAGGGKRVSLNIYGQRRSAGVDALSAASLVTPPSDYLRRVHVAMGVPEERTRWVRLGQPHFDQINRRARRSPFYDTRPWDPTTATRPLRFAFFGTVRPNKGLEVLARAIPLLEPSVRERCQFIIRAQGYEFGFRKRLARFPEVSVWCGYDVYQLISSAGEYDVGVLSHIWLENSPLVLLENFHAGKMVVCSRLGGPIDWVKDPRTNPTDYNGLLFAGGAEQQLAECITRLATGEVAIPSAREIHDRTTLRSYPDHVREVEGIYEEVIARKAGRLPAGGPVVSVRTGAGSMLAGVAGTSR